jgi:hypothetical protein
MKNPAMFLRSRLSGKFGRPNLPKTPFSGAFPVELVSI